MDSEFAMVLYRSLMLICRYLEKRYGFGHRPMPPGDGMREILSSEVTVKG